MIVFFDIIAFDDLPVLKISQCERKRLLGNLVEVIPGHAELADSELLDFATPAAAGRLRELFAASIRAGEEGLILRSADDPYFDFESSPGFRSCCVKLKKSYISGLGEIGDFVIVAGGYDATKAKEYTIPNLQWTHFYVGCLENKEAVLQQGAKASFVVIAVTTLGEKLLRSLFFSSPNLTAPFETNEVFDIRIDDGFLDNVKPSWFFPTMPVVELHCFDFEKKGRTRFWSPRFPSVSKIHDDRSYNDTVSFSELQDMAEAARMTPKQAMCEDGTDWNKVLKMADPRGIPVDAVTPPRTAPQRPDLVLGVTPAAGYTIARPETAPIVSNRGQNDAIHAESITALTLTPPSSSEATSGRTEATTERSNLSVTASQNTSADGLRTSKKRRIEAISQGTFGLTVRPHTIAPSSTSQLANESSTPLPSTPHAHSPLSVVSSNRGAGQSTSTAEYHVPVNQPEDLAKEAEENNDPNHKSSLQERPAAPEAETGGGSPQITPVRKRVRATVESPLGMTPSCKHLKHRCALSNCIILMAGCVSGMPYLTSDLLPAHGVAHFSDVERWAKSHMQTGRERKSRRIVLVESHRKEAVLKMFQDIRDLTARSESTTRTQWVEVYDWRLLEAITRIETGKGVPFNPWRKYWVGAISMSQGHG
jgi:DNA ligase-4